MTSALNLVFNVIDFENEQIECQRRERLETYDL